MGRVFFSGGNPAMAAPGVYAANFEDNTWAEIIEACQKNAVPDTWEVGDQKALTINGKDYLIDIIGKNHDTYVAGGTAPLTFQLHDLYGTNYPMGSSNSAGWSGSSMRGTHLPAIKSLMPTDMQGALQKVIKLTSAGNQSSTINTTEDDLFLLSEIEIFGAITFSVSGEGKQYAYYASGNTKVKNINGTAGSWWTRSPRNSGSTNFCNVYTNGSADASTSSGSRGVSFAFCF